MDLNTCLSNSSIQCVFGLPDSTFCYAEKALTTLQPILLKHDLYHRIKDSQNFFIFWAEFIMVIL